MEIHNGVKSFHAKTRKEWRNWLEKNYAAEKGLWLIIYHKTSSIPSVYYDEAVEEALCFGWIDSKPNKRDGESYYLFFSPRKPRSVWSKVNKARIAQLTQAGLMHLRGLEIVELAKQTGTWDALSQVDLLLIPDEMQKLFKKHPLAKKNFEAFAPSTRKHILQWISNAKLPATRQKRIEETVTLAEQNIKANQYKPK